MEILPKYAHSKFGNFMFSLCANCTKFLVKHKALYYILACTWGSIMTVLGVLLTVVLAVIKLFTKKVSFKKYLWVYFISVGPEFWGGCEMGLMFLRDWKSSNRINRHEFGHTMQNCIFGPLMPFLVCIPSATRYWIRTLFPKKVSTPYDSVWFEDAATQCGEYVEKVLAKK